MVSDSHAKPRCQERISPPDAELFKASLIQAALLRLGVPAIRAELPPRTRAQTKQSGGETRIRRCGDASAKCSGSSRRAPHSAFSACTPPSTTPSTSNATSSHAPRCGSSEPRRPTNGTTRSEQCDRLLRLIFFSLETVNLTIPCREIGLLAKASVAIDGSKFKAV